MLKAFLEKRTEQEVRLALFAVLGAVQGWTLHALLQVFTKNYPFGFLDAFAFGIPVGGAWDAVRMCAAAFLFFGGFVFFQTWADGKTGRALSVGGAFGVLAALCTWGILQVGGELYPFAFASSVVCYVCLPFLQEYVAVRRFVPAYSDLFFRAWNNAQITATSYLVFSLGWGVLALSAELMAIVKIDALKDLLDEGWFILPILFSLKALGYAFARENESIVTVLRRLALWMCRLLAPVLALAAVVFVAFIPLVGLQTIWETRVATPIFLTVGGLTILFFNAVFQDGGDEAALTGTIGNLVRTSLLALPVLGGLAVYSTGLRIAQYALTVDRIVAILCAVYLLLYGVVYAVAAFLPPVRLRVLVQRANIGLAALAALVCVALTVPPLNPVTLTVRSQERYLLALNTMPDAYSFYDLAHNLGAPGKALMEKLDKVLPQDSVLRIKMAEVLDDGAPSTQAKNFGRIADYVELYGVQIPDDAASALLHENNRELEECARKGKACALLYQDVSGDGKPDIVLIVAEQDYVVAHVLVRDERGQWAWSGSMNGDTMGKKVDLRPRPKLISPKWKDIEVSPGIVLSRN